MVYGVGLDIVEIARIRRSILQAGDWYLKRVFTDGEVAYCTSRRRNPYEHFAARFAAKEAFMKALGTGWSGDLEWSEIEVCLCDLGRPSLVLHGEATRLADGIGLTRTLVSLSHCTAYAAASVVLEVRAKAQRQEVT